MKFLSPSRLNNNSAPYVRVGMDDVLLGLFEPLLEPLAELLADGLGEILLEMFYPSENSDRILDLHFPDGEGSGTQAHTESEAVPLTLRASSSRVILKCESHFYHTR